MKRREFINKLAVAGISTALNPFNSIRSARNMKSNFLALHPFIEAHPEAVFIKKTNVNDKTDSETKKDEGLDLARSIFSLSTDDGVPFSGKIGLKPNLTHTTGQGNTSEGMGIITDKYFVEGLIEGIKEVGFPAENVYIREGNWLGDGYFPHDLINTGYPEMVERTGVHLLDFSTGRQIQDLTIGTLIQGEEVIWKDCPKGIVFDRIGFVSPFIQDDTWLLNVSKLKAHGMGLTLCAKNIQGICISPHVHFCEDVNTIRSHPEPAKSHFKEDFETIVSQLYANHLSAEIPRWDRPGTNWNSGFGMELWSHRICDTHSLTTIGLNIIEGIYGRNGDGFMHGPGINNSAEDFLTNILIFGKNAFLVDVIGLWLAGHEPGNFGLFHIARERGLLNTFNPKQIPIYIWDNGVPELTLLTDFPRVPLLTKYLRQDYNGMKEPLYHLVDEPYVYDDPLFVNEPDSNKSDFNLLVQNFPNPFNVQTRIEYCLPRDGMVKMEVYNVKGERVTSLLKKHQTKGPHTIIWNASNQPSGHYFLRLWFEEFSVTRKVLFVK